MKTHFRFLLLSLAVLAWSPAGSANVQSVEPLEPLPVHSNTTRNIVDALASRHYVSTPLDDAHSQRIFLSYLEDLDPSKSYFLASDIADFEPFRFNLDNSLRRGDVRPAFTIFNRYHQRVVDRFRNVIATLEKGTDQFDFTIDESLELDREDASWPKNMDELDDLWRKRIKNAILNLKLADKAPDKIQELLIKRYQNRLARTLQTNSEDVYQLYMNSFTRTYDPHTQYFSPTTSENFNINMSLSLEGIGAVLQREDDYTKVVSLVPAGPADKSKQLFPDDKILAVGQGIEGEMVDVIGWRLDDVVQLIRGKKDTIVRLDVMPAKAQDTSESKVVQITRNTVELEEQSAKSEVIEVEQFGAKHKIGVINIPTFYIDFKAYQMGDKNFKSTTADVKKLLLGLMDEGVEGVVIDLRDNGGGSLQEAKTLTGLFIDQGPTVQIRSKSNRVDVLTDRDFRVVYDGPLAVLVNRLSASASEIFAGAIQDYQRGLIIGSQTFGKGTVQSLLPLNRGQLKMTQAKFYRISGESTQHRGIIPDITYPPDYDPESIGESTLEGPLPWDRIQPAPYQPKGSLTELVPDLRQLHTQRIAHDPEFQYLQGASAHRRERGNETNITLNEAARRAEKSRDDDFWVALENRKRVAEGRAPINSLEDLDTDQDAALAKNDAKGGAGITPPADKTGDAKQDEDLKGNEMASVVEMPGTPDAESTEKKDDSGKDDPGKDEPDAYLVESGNILLDYVTLEHRVLAEKASAL